MRVAVIGLGYIGMVHVAVLLRGGHRVTGIDSNAHIRDCVARGQAPFREPGVAALIAAGHFAGTLGVAATIRDEADADLIFICVGTRGLDGDALDLSDVTAVARDLGDTIRRRSAQRPPLLLVFRSTMLPGSMRDVVLPAIMEAAGEAPGARYDLVYHPEFTREGSALADYLSPARIVLGEYQPGSARMLRELLAGLDAPVFATSFEVAELSKFADNAFHALKVVFANEIGRIAMRSGISPGDVFEIFKADDKLNLSASYLRPGAAFGGPCLPKDVRALVARADAIGVASPILDRIIESNALHTDFLAEEIAQRTAPQSRVLLIGLSFKAETDDLRESSFVRLAERLLDRGHDLSIYDPDVSAGHVNGGSADMPSRVAARLVPDVSAAARWDLVVVGKVAPEILSLIGADCPIFRIDRL